MSSTERLPMRVSIATFNVWGDERITAREESLAGTVSRLSPDVLLLQEVTESNSAVLRRALPDHVNLQMNNNDYSMRSGGDIMWNRRYFDLIDSGFASINSSEYPHRGLHWARLAVKHSDISVFVCTAHLPWCGSHLEVETGYNSRIAATDVIAAAISDLSPPSVNIIFGGDLNEDFHPLRILNNKLGLTDVFAQLDIIPPITHPVRPSDPREEMRVFHNTH